MTIKSDMQQVLESHIGKTIALVVMLQNWDDDRDVGFRLNSPTALRSKRAQVVRGHR
jgi:hypothetical protein